MPLTQTTTNDGDAPSNGAMRAVIYLRVSSDQQVDRGYGDEGYSIPAQREACERKAADLGAVVVREYVDLAKTAKTRNRPRFMAMVDDIERDRDVDFVIVHKLNRFARNAMDDAVIDYRLGEAGAQLASVLEHIDTTPSGKLNHRIHAAFSEYENENLANEIRKGQIEKHRAGGTPFAAPVGYKHAPVEFEGRLINSIVIDDERAPLVQLAFDLYDTGRYSITRLRDTLEEHGLTSRPTRKRASRPLSRSGVAHMLGNPYYVGTVVYMGKKAKGRHPKLIDAELFERVQRRLSAQRLAGDRDRKHQHYLKGSLTCDNCGAKLIYGQHRGKCGGIYEYFSCVRRRARNGGHCDTGHYSVEQVEIEVAALYWSLKLTAGQTTKIRKAVTALAEEHVGIVKKAATRHRRRLQGLEDEQDKLLELHYKGGVAESVMRRQTQRIETEERTLQQLLSRSEIQLAEIRQALDEALKLTETPLETYLSASDLGKRLLNQAFFSEIRVGTDGEVKEATLEKAYTRIIAPRLIRRRSHENPARPVRPQRRPSSDPFSLGPEFDRDKIGAPGEIRTPDLRFRRPTLYPAELRAQSDVVYRRSCASPHRVAASERAPPRSRCSHR
jgi:site-specific DNA recombinase